MTAIVPQNSGPPKASFMGAEACEGRKAFRFLLDFSLGLQYLIDFATWINQKTIESVQGLYVDNSAGTASVQFTFSGTNQIIIVPAGAQAYLPVIVANPPSIIIDCANAAQTTKLYVLNFFVPPYIWGGSQAITIASLDAIISGGRLNARIAPAGLTSLTNRSGTITAGGTGQSLMAANAARAQWNLQNPSTATEVLQFSKIGITGPWYDLVPGQGAGEDGSTVYQGQIWVLGATTAHAFTADEGNA